MAASNTNSLLNRALDQVGTYVKGGNKDVSEREYIRWDSPNIESVPSDEEEDIKAVIERIHILQTKQFNEHGHMYTPTHARTQGIVKGELVVNDNLPPWLAQSLFSNPAKYPVIMRYSTEPGNPGTDDRVPAPRGLAMKVFDVEGEMFEAGADLRTQDIEFNSTPVLEFSDVKTTKEILGLRIEHGHDKNEYYKHINKRKDASLQKARDQVYNTHLESLRMYSQGAHRYGDYVVKYSVVPTSEMQTIAFNQKVDPSCHSDTVLRDWLKDFYTSNTATYHFQVQLLENLSDQSVEYLGTEWDSQKYPWQTVGTLVVPSQDSFIHARKTFWEDHMRLDPWHGLKSFQPLGGSNRLRRKLYPESSKFRRQHNGRKEIQVTRIDQIPDGGFVTG